MDASQKFLNIYNNQPITHYNMQRMIKCIKNGALSMPDLVFQISKKMYQKYPQHYQHPIYLDNIFYSSLELDLPHQLTTDVNANYQVALMKLKSKFKQSQSITIKSLLLLSFSGKQEQYIEYVKKEYSKMQKQDLMDQQIKKKKIALIKVKLPYQAYGTNQQFINSLNKYLQIHPSDFQVWMELAQTYIQHLKLFHFISYTKALFCLQEALLIYPNKVHLYVRLADLYVTLGGYNNLKIARDYLCISLSKHQKNNRGLWMLFRICKNLKQQNIDKNDYKILQPVKQRLLSNYKNQPQIINLINS